MSSTKDVSNQVFVSNIPQEMTHQDVRRLFGEIGRLDRCYLAMIPNPHGDTDETDEKKNIQVHKGYAFLTFEKEEEAKLALEKLNKFEICGHELHVSFRTENEGNRKPGFIPYQQKPLSSIHGRVSDDNVGSRRFHVMEQLAKDAQFSDGNQEIREGSRCILLENMIESGIEIDKELEQDVLSECSTFGSLEKIVFFQGEGDDPTLENVPIISASDRQKFGVKVFVLYKKLEDAIVAQKKFNGRFFAGRTVICSFYNEEDFTNRKFEEDESSTKNNIHI